VTAKRPLERQGAVDRTQCAREDRERLVPRGVDHLAVELPNQRLHQLAVLVAHAHRGRLVAFGEGRVAHHVREHDGQELSVLGRFHHAPH
jgi:hypothetical protein